MGIAWNGRAYRRDNWASADPVNRALSAANAALYGVCHAAIVATGFSPGLGFLHVGKQLSFVYDIADLYKVDVTVPAAFFAVRDGVDGLESRVRRHCRDLFQSTKLVERIVPDLQRVVGLTPEPARLVVHRGEEGEVPEDGLGRAPGALWNEDGSRTDGGRNFAPESLTRTGPSIAKVEPERGDAYEDDLEWPRAGTSDEEVPF
jgi:CRISPR-associated protein Cas1